MTALSVAFLLFVNLYNFPADIDMHNYESGVKNAYKMLGCIVGLWLSFEVDLKFTKFDTDAKWWAQILKFVLGLIPVLLIKIFLKDPCYALCGGSFAGDGIRYFLITAFAGCVWPLTFKWFGKLGK